MKNKLSLENMNEMFYISGWSKKYLMSTLTKQEYDVMDAKGKFSRSIFKIEIINPLKTPEIILCGKKLKLKENTITLSGNKLYGLGLISLVDAGLFVEYQNGGIVPATEEDLSKKIYFRKLPCEEEIRQYYSRQQMTALYFRGGTMSKKEMAEAEEAQEKAIQRQLRRGKKLDKDIRQGKVIKNIIYDADKENKKACTMPSIKISGCNLAINPENGKIFYAKGSSLEFLKHDCKIFKGKLEEFVI
jgi:hypothetical protein